VCSGRQREREFYRVLTLGVLSYAYLLVLSLTSYRRYDFLTTLYAEIKDVFPDKFVHVGGDEVPTTCWQSNPQIVSWLKQHPKIQSFGELEQYYELKLLNILKAQNTSYMCWEEIFDNGVQILDDTVVNVWKGGWNETMAKVTKAGYHSVLSAPFYLNYISYGEDWNKYECGATRFHSFPISDVPRALSLSFILSLSLPSALPPNQHSPPCPPTPPPSRLKPFTRRYYQVEPTDFVCDGCDKSLVNGVEQCMWSEYIDATNFIPRTWPRAAAIAERGWSTKETTDMTDATARMHDFRCMLLTRGVRAEPPTGPSFCPTEYVNGRRLRSEIT
jgi:hexosaminidase